MTWFPTITRASDSHIKVFLSRRPADYGGGSNSFALNFYKYARQNGIRMVDRIEDSDMAIVIAGRGVTEDDLRRARERGCFIVHRIDEHFGAFSDPLRIEKHARIAELNRYASVTVYQSTFVEQTAQPHLAAERYCIIRNGADPDKFHPPRRPGTEVGHVTWSTLEKKGLSDVYAEIKKRPDEIFRLVGVHERSEHLNFRLPNTVLRGERTHMQMPREFRKMKLLYFPSRDDPCPNTVIESIMSGVPVCYHDSGGTPELVGDCGEPLDRFEYLLDNLDTYRQRCTARTDLDFRKVIAEYAALLEQPAGATSAGAQ